MTTWTAPDGTPIYYETHGDTARPNGADRPNLVLVPGLLGSLEGQWAPYVAPLAEDFRVIALDLRGHGRSGDGSAVPTLDGLLGDLIGLLDHLGTARVHLAGYSLGGYLGLMLGLRQPRRLATLLLHGTKFYWSEAAVSDTLRQLDPERIRSKVPGYAAQLAGEHGATRWPDRVRGAAALVAGMFDASLSEAEVAALDCPTVVSVGDRDELVPLQEAVRLRQVLPDASLLVFPRVRHPFGTLRPAELLAVMRGFHTA